VLSASGGSATDRIQRWDGTAWSVVGGGISNPVYALAVLPNGDLVVGGSFATAGGAPVDNLARWDGTTWRRFGAGVDGTVTALAFDPAGRLLVGGNFLHADGMVSSYLARLESPCLPTVAAAGAGCASSGGNNQLVATKWPWAGDTVILRGTGLPQFAFVLPVVGFAPATLPLATVLPQAGVGCNLLAAPDLIDVAISNHGVLDWALPLPNVPSPAGLSLFAQFLPLEVGAQLQFVELTATNALQLTIGVF
jgi:hypothetical protein